MMTLAVKVTLNPNTTNQHHDSVSCLTTLDVMGPQSFYVFFGFVTEGQLVLLAKVSLLLIIRTDVLLMQIFEL